MQSANSSPTYARIGVPDIDGNPLLAHLRLPPENDKAAFLALAIRPQFDPSERELPTSLRRLRVSRLRRFFVPTSPAHRRALIGISSQLFDGYMGRNPLTPDGQSILHGGGMRITPRQTISLVAGYSGMGKSTLLDRILDYMGPQVCRHTAFGSVPFPETQILWLRRNVPEHCTVRTLCSTFGDYTDHVLGLRLYAGTFDRLKGGDRGLYLSEIRKIVTNHHVGVLVLDEFDNLSLMGVGAKKIIALLVNLRDELGLPIVVVGTYKALRLLEGGLSSARRLCEGGYFDLERPLSPNDEFWNELCKIVWEYQWVRNPIGYSSEICEALYEVSQGITGIMLIVFGTAQLAAMEDDATETVTADLIRKVFEERMVPLHKAIRILRSGDPRLMDKFDDIYRNAYPTVARPDEGGEPSEPMVADDETPIKAKKAKTKATSGKRAKTAAASKSVLSEEQIRKLVLADSMVDIVAALETS